MEAGSAKDIRTSPPADLFEEILELQEDLEAHRSLPVETSSVERQRLQSKLRSQREHLEQRQVTMESDLEGLFSEWDALLGQGAPEVGMRAKKDAILKRMRDILSNRTYLRNIINDLIATAGQ